VSVQRNPNKRVVLKHFVRKKNKYLRTIPREPLPPRAMTLAESREFFPNNPHTWLCDGKLLRLLDPENSTNYDMFQVNTYPVIHIHKNNNSLKYSTTRIFTSNTLLSMAVLYYRICVKFTSRSKLYN